MSAISGNRGGGLDMTAFYAAPNEVRPNEVLPGGGEQTGEIRFQNEGGSGDVVLPEMNEVGQPGGNPSIGVDVVQYFRDQMQPPAGVPGIDLSALDVSNPVDALKLMVKSVKGFAAQFVDAGVQEVLQNAAAAVAVANAPEGRRAELAHALESLKGCATNVRQMREELLQHVSKAVAAAETALVEAQDLEGRLGAAHSLTSTGSLNIRADIEAKTKAAIDGMRVAMRNFRYNFDQVSGQGVGAKRAIGQFFSSTHTRLFAKLSRNEKQWFGESRVRWLKDSESQFAACLSTLNGKLPDTQAKVSAEGISVLDPERAAALSETAHQINNANRAMVGQTCKTYLMKSARDQLEAIAKNGGERMLQISGGIGIGFNVGAAAGRAMATLRHTYRLTGTGDGSITVEHALEGGAGGRINVDVGDVARIRGAADVRAGAGRGAMVSRTFADIDSAVNYLTGGLSGSLNPLFIKGRGFMGNIQSVFRRLGSIPNHIHGKGKFNERAFVNDMKRRGVLDQADHVLRRGRNSLKVEERSFTRIGGGGEVIAKVQVPRVDFRFTGEVKNETHRDIYAKKTTYQSYLVSSEGSRRGQQAGFYRQSAEAAKTRLDLRPWETECFAATCTLLDSKVETAGEKSAARKAAIERLQRLRQDLETLENEGESKLDELKHLDKKQREQSQNVFFETLAGQYKRLADALLAVDEFWADKGLAADASSAERGAFDKLKTSLREPLKNPAIKFPPEIFQRTMVVRVAETDDGRIVNKLNGRLDVDMLAPLRKLMMPDFTSNVMSANELVRLGSASAGQAARELAPTQGVYAFDVTTTWPKQPDRRPWSGHKTTEVNLRLPHNVSMTGIAMLILQSYLTANNLPVPSKKDELLRMLQESGQYAFVSAVFIRAGLDLGAQLGLTSAEVNMSDESKNFLANGFLEKFAWDDGRNVHLSYEDGRLTSISFGSHERLEARVSFNFGVALEGGAIADMVVNEQRWLAHPSFDALAHLCDDHLRKDNQFDLTMLAAHNRPAFTRLFDLMKYRGAQDVPPTVRQNGNDRDDLKRIKKMLTDIAADVAEHVDNVQLVENFGELAALLELADGDEGAAADDDVKTRAMVKLFTCISRHYQFMATVDDTH